MTRVVVATEYGGPEVLRVVDVSDPEPGPGEVRVSVRAAGVNRFDIKRYSGTMGNDPSALPMRLGSEAAGVVTAVGPNAVGPAGPLAVGDEVVVFNASGGVDGAYAADIVAPARAVLPKPAGVEWEAAAGLLLTGVAATHAVAAAGVQAGDTVLVHAAAGGVGLIAVQLAVAQGANVIGTAPPAAHDLLRELGAQPVVYGDGLSDRVRASAPDGVDAALDLVGTDEAVDVSLEHVADRQRIATIAAFDRAADAGIKLLAGGPGGDPGHELRNAARADLLSAVDAGSVRVVVAATYPLDDVAGAHRQSMSGQTIGKIVLLP